MEFECSITWKTIVEAKNETDESKGDEHDKE